MKNINEYKREDGYYDIKGDEEYYSDLTEALQTGVMKFCMCSDPKSNLLFILGMLKNIKEHNYLKRKEFVQTNWEHFEQFFWYVMDEKEITEHGTSIPGWIKDENFFNALKQLEGENDSTSS